MFVYRNVVLEVRLGVRYVCVLHCFILSLVFCLLGTVLFGTHHLLLHLCRW